MKYLTIFLLILFPIQFINATPPIEKGTCNISGSIYFTDNLYDDEPHDYYLSISSGIYYFFHKNVSIGSKISYSRLWFEKFENNYYTLNPGIRLYFLTGNNVFPYLTTSFEYYLVDYGNDNRSVLDLEYGFGTDLFISESVALEPYIVHHIKQARRRNRIESKPKELEFGMSLSIFINKEKSNHCVEITR